MLSGRYFFINSGSEMNEKWDKRAFGGEKANLVYFRLINLSGDGGDAGRMLK